MVHHVGDVHMIIASRWPEPRDMCRLYLHKMLHLLFVFFLSLSDLLIHL